jgi:hypothetical protein
MPKLKLLVAGLFILLFGFGGRALAAPPAQNPQNGPIGLEGQIPAAPPKDAATITVPGNGQSFSNIPITVAGICPNGLEIEIYKNNVFSGSTMCNGGTFSLQIDLFDGKNDLVAKDFDDLHQAGPDSNTVSVNFNSPTPSTGPRITLTSAYSRRGAQPGNTLTWPVVLSGGNGPYAISVDWGDKTTADLISRPAAGEFNIEHIYKSPGFYNVTIKATDVNGITAFLQVIGVGNGPSQSSAQTGAATNTTKTNIKIIWWPLIVCLIMIIIAFWLGRRQQIAQIQERLRKGQKPF